MTGPYDYVAPSYWYAGTQVSAAPSATTPRPAPALRSHRSPAASSSSPDPEAWPPPPTGAFTTAAANSKTSMSSTPPWKPSTQSRNSAADYERMAQTMEYDSERAMFEAYSKNKYTSTGVIQWMLNNAWPSMIWHLYDYYLDTGGGFFGTKKACEPLHIQYAYDDHSIDVVNSTYADAGDLQRQASMSMASPGTNLQSRRNRLLHADSPSASSLFPAPLLRRLSASSSSTFLSPTPQVASSATTSTGSHNSDHL